MTTAGKMFLVTAGLLGAVGAGLGSFFRPPVQDGKPEPPPVQDKVRVSPEDDVQRALDRLKRGMTLVFAPGDYRMKLRVQKSQVTLVGEKGARIVAADDPPLLVTASQKVAISGLSLRFEGRERTFPALVVRESSHITVRDCEMTSSRGDGVVADRSPELALERCTIRATDWGLAATGCRKLRLEEVAITGCENQGGAVLKDCPEAALARLAVKGCRLGVRLEGSQATLAGGALEASLRQGLLVGAAATARVGGGTRIAGNKEGIEVEPGGSLLADGLVLAGNRYAGILVGKGAGQIEVTGLDHREQPRPILIEGKRQGAWKIDAKVPVESQ